jgi:hypothetical protein
VAGRSERDTSATATLLPGESGRDSVVVQSGATAAPDIRDPADSVFGGVTIIESSAEIAAAWTVAEEPALQVGVIEGDDLTVFRNVAAAFTIGREAGIWELVVADGASRELRYFDSTGGFRRAVGGQGSGPREFSVLTTVVKLPGDSILVYDIRNRRLTTIGPDGALAGEVSLRTPQMPPAIAGYLVGRLSESEYVFVLRPPNAQTGYRRDTVNVLMWNARSSQPSILAKVSSGESFLVRRAIGGRPRTDVYEHPLSERAVAAVWRDGVVVGNGRGFELRLVSNTGQTQALIRRSDAPEIALEDAISRYVREVTAAGVSKDAIEAELRLFPEHRVVPAYSDILVDDLGMLWVADFALGSIGVDRRALDWTVFDTTGRIIARATIPAGLRLTHVGSELVVGVVKDTLDVEYVTVHRLQRTSR